MFVGQSSMAWMRVSPVKVISSPVKFSAKNLISIRYASFRTRSDPNASFPIRSIGVVTRYYVPPKLSEVPLSLKLKCIGRRILAQGLNFFQVARYKRELKINVQFKEWKEKAVDIYVKTNKAFANKSIHSIEDSVAVHVENALKERIGVIPKQMNIEWKLVKLNEQPRVINFTTIPNQEGVTDKLQVTLKLDTTQQVTITRPNHEPTVTKKSIVQYGVFTIDPYTDDVVFCGTIFESKPTDKVMPDAAEVSSMTIIRNQMKTCGDIFRENPNLKSIKSS